MEDSQPEMKPSTELESVPMLEAVMSHAQEEAGLSSYKPSPRGHLLRSLWPVLHLCAFLLYSALFIVALLKNHTIVPYCSDEGAEAVGEPIIFSPMQHAIHEQFQTIYGNVHATSRYKGPPTAAVDRAWRDLFRYSNIRINAADLALRGRTSVQLNDGSGDFLATPDTYHQLHCLWYIFQNVHPESYTVNATNVPILDHLDHCIDALRQHIMCHATASLQTYSWIPDLKIPWANFTVDNICVDWEEYDGWAKTRSIDLYDPNVLRHPNLGPIFPDGKPTKTNYNG
ncbi:hypothetical protein AAFC00_001966 [Neodothiora populina]|uniref:Uncharacterized protein n=1 Tax=Neodothiora populina TaxID=2781224 RepID=A0ABR3PQS0_9PEZI